MDIIPLIEIPGKKFKILGENIKYKKDSYPLSSLRHLHYQKTRIIQKTNFVKSGEALEAKLTLILDSAKELSIDIDERTFIHGWNSDKKAEISNLDDTFINLLNLTRNIRAEKYFDDVEKLGCFKYGVLKFYPRDKIVNGKKEYRIADYKVFKSGRSILLRNKNDKGILRKIGNYFSNPSFEMALDPDLAFFMLEKFFGWKWDES